MQFPQIEPATSPALGCVKGWGIMLRLREFAGVSVAVSIVMGMVVFSKSPQYRTEIAPGVVAAGQSFAAAGAKLSSQVAALAASSAPSTSHALVVRAAAASPAQP